MESRKGRGGDEKPPLLWRKLVLWIYGLRQKVVTAGGEDRWGSGCGCLCEKFNLFRWNEKPGLASG